VDKFGLVAAMVLQSALRARLTEGRKLIAQLAEGYDKASSALRSYAFALEVAKAHYSNGKAKRADPRGTDPHQGHGDHP
jgi:phage terminase large subunit-like protein